MMDTVLNDIKCNIHFDSNEHYIWPRITKNVEKKVINQLHKSISIYNKSGILKEFEDSFSEYHKVKYALLSNSGTNAIFSMFEGIGLQPGDEIIAPTYTFFATISPVIYTGATPVFCDCDATGNITAAEIEKKITDRTKAVIVTHMWGMPCDMDEISYLCKKKNLYLLEDCSHAHGATYKGRKVGTFGDAAAWSLQGQKIITGGEGGIMLTNNEEIYYRATLQGHYNKRCKQEIPENYELSKFSLTGMGLKFRAHPIAISIALEQFSHLDEFIAQKKIYAEKMISSFAKYPFLRVPSYENKNPSWYAFILQYDDRFSNGISIDEFCKALHFIGLKEVDRPGSTAPAHNFPLFTEKSKIMPRLYNSSDRNQAHDDYSNAILFYKNAIKLPVWAFKDEENIVNTYIEGIKSICDLVMNNPTALKKDNQND